MAVTFTVTPAEGQSQPQAIGQYKAFLADITFSGSYTTGGDFFAPALVGMNKIHAILFCGAAPASALTTADVPGFNPATGKILLYETGASSGAPLAEKGSSENVITGQKVRALILGE